MSDEDIGRAFALLRHAIDGDTVTISPAIASTLHTLVWDARARAGKAESALRAGEARWAAASATYEKQIAQFTTQKASAEQALVEIALRLREANSEIAALRAPPRPPRPPGPTRWAVVGRVWHIAGGGCGEAVGLDGSADAPPSGSEVCPACLGFGR